MKSDESDAFDDLTPSERTAFRQLADEAVPDDFLTQVMARAAQAPLFPDPTPADASQTDTAAKTQLARWRSRLQRYILTPLMTPQAGFALAACLVLSLAGNIWLGTRTWDSSPAPDRRIAEDRRETQELLARLSLSGQATGFNAHRFQARLRAQDNLGQVVAANPAGVSDAQTLGFSATSRFYALGAWYAEALACLQGGALDQVENRLASMSTELRHLPEPNPLTEYLHTFRQALQHQSYARPALIEGLALFQPLAEEQARLQGTADLTLFRIGIWLVNVRLAAATGDTALLHQSDTVQVLRQELVGLNASQHIDNRLDQLHPLMAKPDLTTADVQTILTLVSQLQGFLG